MSRRTKCRASSAALLVAALLISPLRAQTLKSKLLSADLDTHQEAAKLLRKMPDKSKKLLVPDAIAALKESDDKKVRCHAAYTLKELGQATPDVVQALADTMVSDVKLYSRVCAAKALARISLFHRDPEIYKKALPSLVEAMTFQPKLSGSAIKKEMDKMWAARIRRDAVMILSNIAGPQHESLVPHLILALAEESLQVSAARALGKIGPQARDALPTLESLLKHAKDEVRSAAKDAIAKIKQPEKGSPTKKSERKEKMCPECGAWLPVKKRECSSCGANLSD